MRATVTNLPVRRLQGPFDFELNSFKEAIEYATVFSNSDFAGAYKGRPHDIMVIWQMGAELGMGKAQSLRTFGCINGKGFAYGDGKFAQVVTHHEFEDAKEWIEGEGGNMVAYCTIKRKGRDPVTRQYSVEDAKKAELWEKKDNWKKNPRRMLQHRARGYAVNDTFPDAFYGIPSQSEVEDMIDITPIAMKIVQPQNKGLKGLKETLQVKIEEPIDAEIIEIVGEEVSEENNAIIDELLALVIDKNIPQASLEKWKKKFNANVIEDIPIEGMKKIIKHIKEKI